MSDNTTDIILPILREIQEDISGIKADVSNLKTDMCAGFERLERGQDMLAHEVVAIREDIKALKVELLDYKDHERRVDMGPDTCPRCGRPYTVQPMRG